MCSAEARPLSVAEACYDFQQCAELRASNSSVFWLATEPEHGGARLWRWDGQSVSRLDPVGSVRSQINGYGGGSYAVMHDWLGWIAEDQSLWAMHLTTGERKCLCSAQGTARGGLVADLIRQRWLLVQESDDRQALVAVDMAGRLSVLHDYFDFYGAPALSADGRELAWVSWSLPAMPWDQTLLCVGRLHSDGDIASVASEPPPGGGSVQQPQYVGSELWVISDHQGWWQPWCVGASAQPWCWEPGSREPADHANAPWQLGEQHACAVRGADAVTKWARVRYRQGWGELWLEDGEKSQRLAKNFSDFRSLGATGAHVFCIARNPERTDSIVRICLSSGDVDTVFGGERPWPDLELVCPESLRVSGQPTERPDLQGFFYPPIAGAAAYDRCRPPLILLAHGGPTSAAYATFNPQIQFWCQRGFAVAEVNYTGSTGFGRAFRQRLAGQWGKADVADMFRMVDLLVAERRVDRDSVFIQGRSSGGFTALMSAISGRPLRGLASLFGVTDPLRLRDATHRFESGYLDWLLGPSGADGEGWYARTPLRLAQQISCPAIFFQGGQDRVVVPEQTRSMVAALQQAGKHAELLWLASEGHGFRSPASQAQVLDGLMRFYARLLQRPGVSQKNHEAPENLS